MKEKIFKWWARISAIVFTYMGLNAGAITVLKTIAATKAELGYFSYDIVSILLIIGLFVTTAGILLLIAVPLWYYGFRKN